MRGKATYEIDNDLKAGITPAYAGKRDHRGRAQEAVQDHPRLCGEKLNRLEPLFCTQGSPPPMRGKGIIVSSVDLVSGITPAYAGKS